jgi:hypothetical protein
LEDKIMQETTALTFTPAAWLPAIRHQLAGLGLPPEWSEETVEAPTNRASKSADCTLRLLAELGLEPSWLLPSPEGGICIAFARDGRYAEIQFLNRGEIITTRSEGAESLSQILQSGFDLRAAAQTIRSFLGK